jgi:hypothetical protein
MPSSFRAARVLQQRYYYYQRCHQAAQLEVSFWRYLYAHLLLFLFLFLLKGPFAPLPHHQNCCCQYPSQHEQQK